MKFSKIILFGLSIFLSCKEKNGYVEYHGEAQGTTFLIKYHTAEEKELQEEIDSIFNRMDALFSGYKEDSYVSRFNSSKEGLPVDYDFLDLWEKCWELSIETDGYFDPTLSPVIKIYREMKSQSIDSASIEEALSHTGMPLVIHSGDSLKKKDPHLKIDLDAVAQGYTVDVLSRFLEKQGSDNYLIEVGGEVYAKGKNEKNKKWTIGIDKPIQGERKMLTTIEMDGSSMATSGNYRKFKEIGGKKVGHILNPKSGYPMETNVLSVSVISRFCYRADALATALMNRSVADIKDFDAGNNDVQIILVEVADSDTLIYVSPELSEKIKL